MNKKLQMLLVALSIVLATYSQTPDTLYVDGWDYPVDDRGYTADGSEYEITENLTPEQNTLYPNNPVANPQRECSTGCTGIFSAGDEGDFGNSSKGDHPGGDLNREGGDSGDTVFVAANGLVVDIKISSGAGIVGYSGWVIVVEHYYEGDSINTSEYNHVTTLDSIDGGLCDNITDFTVAIGEWVTRGQPIARIGSGYTAPVGGTPMSPHLHFSIRNSLYSYSGNGNVLYPRDNGRGGYGGLVDCIAPCANSGIHFAGSMTAEQTAIAFANMQRDGIVDGTDFIDAHRPSTFAIPAPEIEWQNTIGGGSYEYLSSIEQTPDGGYILGGYSNSIISGDKTEASMGTFDYWVIKLSNTGDIEWQNTIGGSFDDLLAGISITADEGYILAGWSYSGISGDKTETSKGGADYWIVKLNSDGSILWDKTIGGNVGDIPQTIKETSDGGCIVGGYSYSGISGDKTETNIGLGDYWVIKLSNTGDIEWQNTIGGSEFEVLSSVNQTSDGGYILGGSSQSGISGDKTEGNLGAYDYWVVKLNHDGVLEWENTIGGTGNDELQSIIQTPDGGYILGGYSNSIISGDKIEEPVGNGDGWIIKLNSSGYIEWQNTIGGTLNDLAKSISPTYDGGYVFTGYSNSGISGDKTETCLGFDDFWVVKLNNIGSIEWDNTIGSSGQEQASTISQTIDGGYIVGGTSNSGISGDKTEASLSDDYWIVKLVGNCIPTSEICNSIDDDCDGIVDNGVVETISISAGGPTTFCQGNSVVLTATYTGTSIQWKKDEVYIAGATSSTYTATTSGVYSAVSSSLCGSAISAGINVTANKNPTAAITAGGPTTFCSGGSVVLTANAGGGLSYQWYKGATAIAGATSINYTATTTGNYKCRVTKTATGCFKNSNAISVSVTCKEGLSSENSLLSPNPASDYIYLNLDQFVSNNIEIIVINNIGQIVLKKLIFDQNDIDVTMLSKGMYVINLIQDGKFVHSEKFIIE